MTANDSKSYPGYFNKVLDEQNNIYHCSISKKPIDVDYSALTEETESNIKAPKSQVSDRNRTTKYKYVFSKDYTKNLTRWILAIDSILKTYCWMYEI